jgi:uncharacterized caspase-like protein
MRQLALALALSLLWAGSASAGGPRTIAFVVGVERYKEAELDTLTYVNEDARKVWNALKEITAFDESRSQLLLGSDRSDRRSAPEYLSREKIRDALEAFLEGAKDEDLVILYFGGHGTVRADGEKFGVSFLPADFTKAGFRKNLSMSHVLDEIRMRLSAQERLNISVIVLANMCHAGAQGAMDADMDREVYNNLRKEFTAGIKRFAYIPATTRKGSTYEMPELDGSLFVRYFVEALRGRGMNEEGEITTARILQHLQKSITPDPPPTPAHFDEIVIGTLTRHEAQMRAWLGQALVSAALDQGEDPYLLQLAINNFERSRSLWDVESEEVALREAEVRLLRGDAVGSARLLGEVAKAAPRAPALAERAAALLKELNQVSLTERVGESRAPLRDGVSSARQAILPTLPEWYFWAHMSAALSAYELPLATRNALDASLEYARNGRWDEAIQSLSSLEEDPWVSLRLGALHESAGQLDKAKKNYERFATWAGSVGRTGTPGKHDVTATLRSTWQKAVADLLARVRRRYDALSQRRQPRIHVVAAAARDYRQQVIADLSGTQDDVNAWLVALRGAYKDRIVEHSVHEATDQNIRRAMEEAAKSSSPDDLIVFLFSGRGLTFEGERYLVPVDAYLMKGELIFQLIAVSEINQAFRGKNVVAIFDAQFSAPTGGVANEREKHFTPGDFGRVRGDAKEGVAAGRGSPRPMAPPVITSYELISAAHSRDHLLIWSEGPLEEWSAPRTEKVLGKEVQVWSPLSWRLIRSLGDARHGTYRDWIDTARRNGGNEESSIQFSGPVHRPLLRGGLELDELASILDDGHRRELNLELGARLFETSEMLLVRPEDRVAHAGLLLSLAELRRTGGDTTRAVELRRRAQSILEPFKTRTNDQSMKELLSVYLLLYSKAQEDPAIALDFLLKQPSHVFLNEDVARRLVEVMQEDLDRSAATKIERVRSMLLSAEKMGADSVRARLVQQLNGMLHLERNRARRSRTEQASP